jgi:hypothetical protein
MVGVPPTMVSAPVGGTPTGILDFMKMKPDRFTHINF